MPTPSVASVLSIASCPAMGSNMHYKSQFDTLLDCISEHARMNMPASLSADDVRILWVGMNDAGKLLAMSLNALKHNCPGHPIIEDLELYVNDP